MKQNQQFRGMGLILLVMALIFFASTLSQQGNLFSDEMTYQEFMTSVENGAIETALIRQNAQTPTGVVMTILTNGERGKIAVSDVMEVQQLFREKGIDYLVDDVPKDNYLMTIILPIGLSAVVIMFLMMYMNARIGGGGGNSKMMNFGKSRAKMSRTNSVDFSKVAGLEEEKEDLEEIVDFLKNPKKYTDVGARIPKGVILVGPPGTGKTLLAKAVAGEAGVPFFSISGSDFVEMFVGVGASRVRDLFEQAKKMAPSIIFIDEIDAVGRRRGAGLGGGHDEREQTLNQLLVEMDGFGKNEGVIVMAATNRQDILDPALLRPGRFDRQVYVGAPDAAGREAILKVHSKDKPLADNVRLDVISRATAGFTGADLANLLNEAALLAARKNRRVIIMADLEEAMMKVIAGPEKRSRVVSRHERRLTAVHEAGHAIVMYRLPTHDPVHQITIIPRGSAGGMTVSLPGEDRSFASRNEMFEDIVAFLGGRVAEQLQMDDISTGASNDLQRATGIARDMVSRYGMSARLGPVSYANDSEIFVGRDYEKQKSYSERVAGEIDDEVADLMHAAYRRCTEILEADRDKIEEIAAYLLEHNSMSRDQFEAAMEGRPIPEGSGTFTFEEGEAGSSSPEPDEPASADGGAASEQPPEP